MAYVRCNALVTVFLAGVLLPAAARATELVFPDTIPRTKPLLMAGEIDRKLLAGVGKFLDRELTQAADERVQQIRGIRPEAWPAELVRRRKTLQHILGIREQENDSNVVMEIVADVGGPLSIAENDLLDIVAVRWKAFGNVHGEGLLLRPKSRIVAHVVAVPDADQTPESLLGTVEGQHNHYPYPVHLANHGCQVLIPTLISRQRDQFRWHGRRVDVTNREFLYRSAFELGRHLIGYEVQKLTAAVSWFQRRSPNQPIAVVGWGEGGALALFAGALDNRIDLTVVSGYFEPRQHVWRQPLDRNVFGRLHQFGDAELATMIAPRGLIVEAAEGPELTLAGGQGAPAVLTTPDLEAVQGEYSRAIHHAQHLCLATGDWLLTTSGTEGRGLPLSKQFCHDLLARLTHHESEKTSTVEDVPLRDQRIGFDPAVRLHRQMVEMDEHSQSVLRDSSRVRSEFMRGLTTDSLKEFVEQQPGYRERFARDVVGRFEDDLLPPNARTRKVYEKEKWVGYEVVLDVFPDVIAYGLLLLPRDLKSNEKRPVVVCQHGLEGRPQDVIGEASYHYYKAFAAQLAERGFITFAPQNLYRHRDEFRVLQRKANPLGKTLFSIITPQHQQILRWLKTHPQVAGDRIAFYGLSYGGKTAMRVPALLPDYCLSICSADFNDWVDKNASTHNPRSYVWTGEYEIFEFDLGSTFNYAEMAALIAPRPFMVERGHDDGVADDETVAYEFAKVRRRYVKLGIGDRCEIEWFDGPHTINGQGTFEFLHRHLNWPNR